METNEILEQLIMHNKLIKYVLIDNISDSSKDSLETILLSNDCIINALNTTG